MEESPTYYLCNECDKSFNHKIKLLVHTKHMHPKSESLPTQSTNSDPSEMGTVKLWEFSRENYRPSDPQLPQENNTVTIDTKTVELDGVAVQMFVIRLGRNFNSCEDQSSLALAEFVDCEKDKGSQEELLFQRFNEGPTFGNPTSVPPSKERQTESVKRVRNEFETFEEPQIKIRKISSSTIASNLGKHERIHTREKPHQCQYCDYSSETGVNLRQHERNHTRGK